MTSPRPDVSDDSTRDVSQVLALEAPAPATLPLPLAVAELEAALRQRRDEPWGRAQTALREEWRRATAAIGPRLRETLGDRPAGADARLSAATDRASREAAADVLAAVAEAALSPDGLLAAWQDVVAAAGDDRISARRAVAARAQLKGLLTASGRDTDQIERRVRAVLDDDAVAIAEMRHRSGDLPTVPSWRDLRQRLAGASAPDRHALAAAAITDPPPAGRCIGWVAFAHAGLNATRVPAGPVTFFAAEWAIANARDDGQPFPERAELVTLSDHLPGQEDVGDVVLARVDLGDRSAPGAAEDAQDVAMAVVEIATVGETGSAWRPFGWTALLLNDAPRLVRWYDPDADRNPTPWSLQRVAVRLDHAVPHLASALASPGLPATLRTAVRAAADGHEAHGPVRILTQYRLLELIAAHAGRDDPWQIGEPVAAQWPMASWRRDASSAVGAALQAARSVEGGLDRVAGVRTTSDGAGGFVDHLTVAADRCDQLADAADGWLARWIREPIAAVDDPVLLTSILDGYQEDRRLLRSRFQRIRDAFVHGNAVDAAAAASVDDFARFVGQGALASALDAFRDGTELHEELARRHGEARARARAVRTGTPIRRLWSSM